MCFPLFISPTSLVHIVATSSTVILKLSIGATTNKIYIGFHILLVADPDQLMKSITMHYVLTVNKVIHTRSLFSAVSLQYLD